MFSRKPRSIDCFFCLGVQDPPPRDPRSFQCQHCAVWNRYGADGKILSDEPAMHNEELNIRPRASPSKSALPSSFATPVFCRTCQTNQTLLINLLANYLPEPSDPGYAEALSAEPAYRASLHARYPPVCAACAPAVDGAIREREYMARTAALGGWLKRTRTTETVRRARTAPRWDEHVWRLRGALWTVMQVTCIATYATVLATPPSAVRLPRPAYQLSLLVVSLLWTFWDPLWLTVRRARAQGHAVRVQGIKSYRRRQLTAWLSRFLLPALLLADARSRSQWAIPGWCLAALGIEVVCGVLSHRRLSIQRPASVRLIDSSRPASAPRLAAESPPDPVADPEPLLSALSLAPQPAGLNVKNPIFGQTSLPSAPVLAPAEDSMDWTPTDPAPDDWVHVEQREGWLRPQRFFAPEQPTGLEVLLERTTLREPPTMSASQATAVAMRRWPRIWVLGFFLSVALSIVAAAIIHHRDRWKALRVLSPEPEEVNAVSPAHVESNAYIL